MMTETVLVTGGTGYLAGWCLVELLRRGYRVRTTIRSPGREAAVRVAVGAEVDLGDRLTFAVADLTADAGWEEAVAGCDYVLHVASSLGGGNEEKDPDSLIVPAREGTLRVLRAAVAAGVQRVVMTSSCAAATPPTRDDIVVDETVWTDPDQAGLTAYRRSKTVAERAAWDYIERADGSTQLTTVLPGAIFGPALTADNFGSLQILSRMLEGRVPRYPSLAFEVVDVRDVADLHIRAMTAPEAEGERFIATGELLWMGEVAAILREQLGPAAAKVPTKPMPDLLVRVAAPFNPELRTLLPLLGRKLRHSSAKAQRMLGWQPRPAADTVVDSGRNIIGWTSDL